MANKKPKKSWKKGQSGNPKGRPKLPADIKQGRRLNQVEFERSVNQFLFQTKDSLHELLDDPTATVFELLIGTMMLKAIREGDHVRLSFLLDRLIGKCPETANVNLTGIPKWVVSLYQMSPEQRRKRYEAMKKKRRKKK